MTTVKVQPFETQKPFPVTARALESSDVPFAPANMRTTAATKLKTKIVIHYSRLSVAWNLLLLICRPAKVDACTKG